MVKYKCRKCGGEDHGYWVDVEAKTGVQTVFKSEYGEVWKDSTGNYGTMSANHFLCVEMAKEIERLRLIVDATKGA